MIFGTFEMIGAALKIPNKIMRYFSAAIATALTAKVDHDGLLEISGYILGIADLKHEAETMTKEAVARHGCRVREELVTWMEESGYVLLTFKTGGIMTPNGPSMAKMGMPIIPFMRAVMATAQQMPFWDENPLIALRTAAEKHSGMLPGRPQIDSTKRKRERTANRQKTENDKLERQAQRFVEAVRASGKNPAEVLEKITKAEAGQNDLNQVVDDDVDNFVCRRNLQNSTIYTPNSTNATVYSILRNGEVIAEFEADVEPEIIVEAVRNARVPKTVAVKPQEPVSLPSVRMNSGPKMSTTPVIGFVRNIYNIADKKTGSGQTTLTNTSPFSFVTAVTHDNPNFQGVSQYYGSVRFEDDNGGTDIVEIRQQTGLRAADLAAHLLPGGKRVGNYWRCGSVAGESGKSLAVTLVARPGVPAGKWMDRATGQHGDLIDLWRIRYGMGFSSACRAIERFLTGRPPVMGFLAESRAAVSPATIQATAEQVIEYAKPDLPAIRKSVKRPTEIASYLRGRFIAEKAITVYKVGQKDHAKLGPLMVFPFFRADSQEIINVKYSPMERETGGKKRDSWFEKGCQLGLWGWHAVGDWAGSVVICEGEIDALSWYTLGLPALSLPNGAIGYSLTKDDMFHLRNFKHIYLSLDMDHAGRKGVEKLCGIPGFVGKLPVSIIKLPYKDVNECLMRMNPDEILEIVADQT